VLVRADARRIPLVDNCVDCVVTSPPYWGLRDYGTREQIGVEATPEAFVHELVVVFREVRRVLKGDGTLWLNLGDCYNAGRNGGHPGGGAQWKPEQKKYQVRSGANVDGLKPKDLIGIPWMVAFALRADGWYLRSDIVWHKPNPMPESVTDRPTKAHEYLFLLAKSDRYHYDAAAIVEPYAEITLLDREQDGGMYEGEGTKDYAAAGVQNPSDTKRRIAASIQKKLQAGKNERSGDPRKVGFNERWDRAERKNRLRTNATASDDYNLRNGIGRNKRSVWTIRTQPYSGAHFATMPEALVEPCILAGCRPGALVLDPFIGSGTVGAVAARLGRRWVGLDLNYHELAKKRTAQRGLLFSEASA
jgi:DNA modification methylase